jgi:signal transduction histidine kinase/ferredoxin
MQMIGSNPESCIGCNRCVRECPMETANRTYLDGDNNIKVKVDASKCIACGACIAVCKHNARFYCDDTEHFFDDLAHGERISIIAAPALKVNFPEWRRMLTWLRSLGIANIYDASLGADICIWGHLRYIERNPSAKLITQPCPAIVSYCELHRHDLLPHLSPVQSPMASLAVYLRKYAGLEGKIASLSPCIAKSNEHHLTGIIDYNITFARLEEYMRDNGVELPEEASGFDLNEAGLGSLFPMPGGLKENLEYFLGKTIRVDAMEGRDVYPRLDEYAQTPSAFLPDVFDVLNCRNGCSIGPACVSNLNLFQINTTLNESRQTAISSEQAERNRARLAHYDKTLRLDDFLRVYKTRSEPPDEVTERDIQKAFVLLKKDTFASQNFNCGACGSETCHEMARKIALGTNIPVNCIVKARDDAERERHRNANYLSLVHNIGEDLLTLKTFDVHDAAVIEALRALCGVVEGGMLASLWRCMGDGKCSRVYGWYDEANQVTGIMGDWPTRWIREISSGRPMEVYLSELTEEERKLFSPEIVMLLLVPLILRGEFWGFIVMATTQPILNDEEFSVIDAAGILIASSIIGRELTEELIDAREEAFSASRAKGDFLSNMSHEMRTPMNVIIGMTSIGRRADEVSQKDYAFEKIQGASTHLLGVINDILDMSRIESGKLELSVTNFDFRKTLRNVVDVIDSLVKEKKQTFCTAIDEQIPPILIGDERRLAQVVINLLANAVKFTPEEGVIHLDVNLLEMKDRACLIEINVTDTGIGISPEQQEKLFASFQQAESSTSRKFGGTGLGLAISKNIVQLMDGEILLRSTLGEGSVFSVRVSLEQASASAPTPKPDTATDASNGDDGNGASNAVPDFSDYHVLLAEDVAINHEIVSALLAPTMLSIDWAQNGVEAVRMYTENPDRYNLIFMDLQMPVMDGIEATQKIRASGKPGAAEIPIVAMTANVFREDVEKCRAASMNHHIGKPLDFGEVLETLRKHLR